MYYVNFGGSFLVNKTLGRLSEHTQSTLKYVQDIQITNFGNDLLSFKYCVCEETNPVN